MYSNLKCYTNPDKLPSKIILSEWLFNTTVELNRYQDMIKELIDYAIEKDYKDILDIIKKNNC